MFMNRTRLFVLICAAALAMALPVILLQVTSKQPVSAETESPQLYWASPHIGFVVDTTSGMQPKINQINEAWDNWSASLGWTGCLTCTYHLTQFRNEAQYMGNTQSGGQFGNWLSELTASGGGSCPDNALAGLREFAINAPDSKTPSSHAIVFTDAPMMGNRPAFGFVLDRLLDRGVRVHSVGRALCNNENILPEIALNSLSLLTGGEFYRPASATEYMTETLMAINLASTTDLLTSKMGMLSGETEFFPFYVDESMTSLGVDHHWWCLTCTRATEDQPSVSVPAEDDITIDLIDPDGNVVGASTPGYLLLDTSTRDMQIMFETFNAQIKPGLWNVRVSGHGEYAISVIGSSDIHLVRAGKHTVRANKPFELRAWVGMEDHDPDARCHEIPCGPLTATFKLMELHTFDTIPVDMFNIGMPPSVYRGTANVSTPGLYRLVVEGEMADGTKFMRIDPVPIRVRAHSMAGSGAAPALPGSTRSISFELINDGVAGRVVATTFDLELFSEQGWTTSDTIPASVTLNPGESVRYTVEVVVSADADIGSVEESTLVAVPQDDLAATTSSTAQTFVVEQLGVFLPSVLR
jgi:hypothetical protein